MLSLRQRIQRRAAADILPLCALPDVRVLTRLLSNLSDKVTDVRTVSDKAHNGMSTQKRPDNYI